MAESDLDPYALEFLSDPYPQHQVLREAGAVVWLSKYDIVALARHAEVSAALDDWETFCSNRGVGLSDFLNEEPWRPPSIILEADPPLHTRARAVLSRVLSKNALAGLTEPFVQVARVLVSELLERSTIDGTIDGIRDLAEAYPLAVFPDAVGVVKEGRENLLPYGDMAFNAFGPRNELFEKSFANAQKGAAWIATQCQRESLDAQGIGAQIYAAADTGEIDAEEAGMLVRSLLTAGLDTTIFSIGAALYCFAAYPDQWQLLRNDPRLARPAFAEVIRFISPVQTFFRTTTCEVEVAGTRIPKGQKVLLILASANRDPRKWENPERFEIQRRVAGHVGFGHGIHMCVGQQLARLEGEVILRVLAEKVAAIELAGEPMWRLNNTLHGLDHLPLRLEAS